jgi:BirA family biotin operon repressor/biotin-[acetyl-CoA-carboxylase] ligase
MVNVRRKELVKRLTEADGPLSGEELGRVLGISRVAVWKHIRELSDSGYAVETTPRGYRLETLPDTLDDWSFPGLTLPVHHYTECFSTMETARGLFRNRELPYAVVADRQTGGRDHDRSEWVSPPGGIYLTLVVPPRFPYGRATEYNRLGCEAVRKALAETTGLDAEPKPPARLFMGDTCVAGVMTELYGPFDNSAAAAIGIGINVNGNPGSVPVATLSDFLDRKLSRREILDSLLHILSRSFHE